MNTAADEQASNPEFPESLQQAAEWHVLIHSGEADDDDLRNFEAWRAHPDHAKAYEELDAVWNHFDAAASPPARQALQHALEDDEQPKTSRVKKAGAALSGALALLVCATAILQSHRPSSTGVWLSRYLSPSYLFSDYNTHVGEQQTIVLSDQTRIVLNTFTAIDVEYSLRQRQIRLLQGEIYLDVAGDPSHPFAVISEHGSATALGTRYSVYDRGDKTDVIVTESRVRVCASNDADGAHCERLSAGQTTSVSRNGVAAPQPVNLGFKHDWATNQLIVDSQPLLKVLDELSRYRLDMIHIDREAFAGYRVSGVFPLDDSDRALAVLERSLPIEISHYTPLLTVITRR